MTSLWSISRCDHIDNIDIGLANVMLYFVDSIAHVNVPVLFLHAVDDGIVPYHLGRKVLSGIRLT